MLGELVATCTGTVGATILVVAIIAAGFSLFMGMRELSRRSEAAAIQIPLLAAHAAARDIGDADNPLSFLRLDPDLEHATILAPDGLPLLSYDRSEALDAGAIAAAARLPDGALRGEQWSTGHLSAVTAVTSPASLAGAKVLLVYSTSAASDRAICQFLLFLCSGIGGLVLIATILRVAFARRMRPLRTISFAPWARWSTRATTWSCPR